ncbi:MAG TPA: septum formation initiator family protein [Rhizomicrobium sp.]|nr:septum formation initiator family protein [Rhizomicrobium sp.]
MPSISAAAIAYFGYHALWGERGWTALMSTRGRLAAEEQQLEELRDGRAHLERRIDLVRRGDPDILQELRRQQLLGAGEVAVPRGAK